jgi:hypothetical protein
MRHMIIFWIQFNTTCVNHVSIFLQELWFSHVWLWYWMQEMHIANITLRICNHRLKCDNCNFCGEKTKVYTEAWNYLHVAVLNLDVKY